MRTRSRSNSGSAVRTAVAAIRSRETAATLFAVHRLVLVTGGIGVELAAAAQPLTAPGNRGERPLQGVLEAGQLVVDVLVGLAPLDGDLVALVPVADPATQPVAAAADRGQRLLQRDLESGELVVDVVVGLAAQRGGLRLDLRTH